MMNIDMWYGNKITDADNITWAFYPNDCVWRGNILKAGRYIGDYTARDFQTITKRFSFLFKEAV